VCINEAPTEEVLLQSAREGNCALLSDVLSSESVNTEFIDANGYTALHWAAMEGFYGAAEVLLAAGADHNARDPSGWAPIHHASQKGHVQVVLAMVDGGADLDCRTSDAFQRTPIQLASWGGHTELVMKLLEQGACINDVDHSSYMNALHYAARYNRLGVVHALLEMGSDVNSVAFDGKTALHFAAKEGHIQVVHALVLAGAEIDAVTTDQYSRTPLHYASYNGNFDVIQYLVAAGGRVEALDADGRSVITLGQCNPEIHVAITEGQSASYQQRLNSLPSTPSK
jgi:cytohesin